MRKLKFLIKKVRFLVVGLSNASSNSPKNKDFSHMLVATVQGFLHLQFYFLFREN